MIKCYLRTKRFLKFLIASHEFDKSSLSPKFPVPKRKPMEQILGASGMRFLLSCRNIAPLAQSHRLSRKYLVKNSGRQFRRVRTRDARSPGHRKTLFSWSITSEADVRAALSLLRGDLRVRYCVSCERPLSRLRKIRQFNFHNYTAERLRFYPRIRRST